MKNGRKKHQKRHLHNEFGHALGTARKLAGHASVLYGRKMHKRADVALQKSINELVVALDLLREIQKSL